MLLAYAAEKRMLVHQMDVVTAFLNGVLDEEIYMKQPPGFCQPGNERLVCKLNKSLYGLKQSPRCWNSSFTEQILAANFKQSEADPCVFIRNEGAEIAIIAIYVDDLILITSSAKVMQDLKSHLMEQYKMKDMGKLHYCLGLAVEQNDNTGSIRVHQASYLKNILEKYKLSDANIVNTPMDVCVKLQKDDGFSKPVDQNYTNLWLEAYSMQQWPQEQILLMQWELCLNFVQIHLKLILQPSNEFSDI